MEEVLIAFCVESGQKVSILKSRLFFSRNMPLTQCVLLSNRDS